jgi:alpha-1,2-mannosyltransferase
VGEPAGIAVCAVTGLLVSPISWSHHWVWWILPALVLAHAAWTRRSGWLAAATALWAVWFYVGPFWFVPHRNHRDYPHGVLQQIQSSAYVWVGLVALMVTAVGILRSRRPGDTPEQGADQLLEASHG